MAPKYVVLGGGNAAGYVAREFVKRGVGAGELLIVTDEPAVSYERPALSKGYLLPNVNARLPGFHTCVGGGGDRQDPDWYQSHGIEFKTNTLISSVDIAGKTIESSSGEVISYEKLIIATGARPIDLATDFKTPGADLGNIYYLRNVADADKLVDGIAAAKAAGGKAVVVGGGYIGLETAAALNMNGLDVSIVFPESRFIQRLFTPEIAAFYEEFYASKGVKMLRNALATSFEGTDGKVTRTVLKDGTKLESDMVVVGVGARPNVELFEGQLDFLTTRPGGIKVNCKFQTSHPDVYAIGDVAAFPLLKDGGSLGRQEHVQNARLSAAQAVTHILDGEATGDYDYLPYFYSRVYNLSWQFYGISEGGEPHFFGNTVAGKFGTYWVKDGKVTAAFLEGGAADETAAIQKVALTNPPAPESGVDFLEYAAKL